MFSSTRYASLKPSEGPPYSSGTGSAARPSLSMDFRNSSGYDPLESSSLQYLSSNLEQSSSTLSTISRCCSLSCLVSARPLFISLSHHECPVEFDKLFSVLIVSPRKYLDYTHLGPAFRFPGFHDFTLGVYRVSGEYRLEEPEFIKAQHEPVHAGVFNEQPNHRCQREKSVNHHPSRKGFSREIFPRVVTVEVDLVAVVCDQCEPDVIRVRNRSTHSSLELHANTEIFVEGTALHTFVRHSTSPSLM